ncbi:hypothetical protein FACS1894140_2430 [Spirochaetia bacterium]|nr:hypothetical protein FACS1894140_2430 [Spirochaetia bacterium]
MKRYAVLLSIMFLSLTACASQGSKASAEEPNAPAPSPAPSPALAPEPAYTENSLTLDAAIAEAASYFTARLVKGSKAAITGFEAEAKSVSDYIFEELWNSFENSNAFVMVDRRNLEQIRRELNYQMSGEVSDESARSIGQQYGAQTIIYGQMTRLGNEYRLVMYATDVERANSSMRTFNIRPDTRLTSLLDAGSAGQGGLDGEIDRAVAAMGRNVNQRLKVGIGRISLNGSGTVTSLSDYLKRNIEVSASRQQAKYLIVSDTVSSEFAASSANQRGLSVEGPAAVVQGIVVGSFSPLGRDAEVSLQLISTARDKAVLGSAVFVIPADELGKRNLSMLPPKNNTVISQAEFNAKQLAIAPYDGKNNAFTFTVTPDDLDGIYYDGEYMTLRIYTERDCYFKITHLDVEGNTQVIYPRASQDNNFIKAGETRQIPDNTRFRMGRPYGEEYILVAAYEKPFTLTAGSVAALSNAIITRGLVVENQGGAAAGGQTANPVATARFSYTILPKD